MRARRTKRMPTISRKINLNFHPASSGQSILMWRLNKLRRHVQGTWNPFGSSAVGQRSFHGIVRLDVVWNLPILRPHLPTVTPPPVFTTAIVLDHGTVRLDSTWNLLILAPHLPTVTFPLLPPHPPMVTSPRIIETEILQDHGTLSHLRAVTPPRIIEKAIPLDQILWWGRTHNIDQIKKCRTLTLRCGVFQRLEGGVAAILDRLECQCTCLLFYACIYERLEWHCGWRFRSLIVGLLYFYFFISLYTCLSTETSAQPF